MQFIKDFSWDWEAIKLKIRKFIQSWTKKITIVKIGLEKHHEFFSQKKKFFHLQIIFRMHSENSIRCSLFSCFRYSYKTIFNVKSNIVTSNTFMSRLTQLKKLTTLANNWKTWKLIIHEKWWARTCFPKIIKVNYCILMTIIARVSFKYGIKI